MEIAEDEVRDDEKEPSKSEQFLADKHASFKEEFSRVQEAMRDERIQCLQDRRFYSIAGAQWEDELGEQFANLPRFELNKIHMSVIRIINEYRNNRITVQFLPKDGEKDDVADNLTGMYRADEQDSGADEAYDNAFEESVGGGIGAWRLRNDLEDPYDDENEKQRIFIEPIFDADSCVFFDLGAKRQDKADAKRCWVLTSYTYGAYEEEFGDSPASWPKDVTLQYFDWVTPDNVWVAECYEVEEKKETCYYMRDINDQEEEFTAEEYKARLQELTSMGYKLNRTHKKRTRKVHKYIMNGAHIIEDCGFIAGKHIPIVMKYGKRWYVDSIERCMGHVRLSKDAQRLKNMQVSRLGQIASLSPVEKPIFTPEQVAGHAEMWASDNIEDYAYLLINSMKDMSGNPMPAAALGYTKPPSLPPALAVLMQQTEADMQDMLGNQQQGDMLQANQSGKAVELIQNRLDMQAFIYIDNQAKAMKRCGEIWLSMAKEVYCEDGRKMKTISEQGARGQVELMRPITGEDGSINYENDLSKCTYDVITDVGASFSSKREATIRALTNLLQTVATTDPQQASIIAATIMMNMEGEGLGDLRDYFRAKLVQQGIVKPTDEEAKQLEEAQAAQANQPPDANTQYLLAEAKKAEGETEKNKASTAKTLADTNKTNAETQQILQTMDNAQRQQVIDMFTTFIQMGSQGAPMQQPAPEQLENPTVQ